MDIKIENKKISGVLTAPESKSMAHRYLICHALTKNRTDFVCNSSSDDICATRQALESLGLYGETDAEDELCIIECRDSASTLRFFIPLAAALGRSCEFRMGDSLAERPLKDLLTVLKIHGVKHEYITKNRLRIFGQLTAGTFVLPGNVSSQYISGLLFALPLLKMSSKILVEGKLQSEPYIKMTLKALKDAGIRIDADWPEEKKGKAAEDAVSAEGSAVAVPSKNSAIGAAFKIPGGQQYYLSKVHKVEGDWSNSAVFMIAAALTKGRLKVDGLDVNSLQGDKVILNILRAAGAEVAVEEEIIKKEKKSSDEQAGFKNSPFFDMDEDKDEIRCHITVSGPHEGEHLKALHIDAGQFPDLVPALAVLGACSDGISKIINIDRLRIKESDRIEAMIALLTEAGVRAWMDKGCLNIAGYPFDKPFRSCVLPSYNDHRIVMMGALMAVMSDSSITVQGAEAVTKSYPDFFVTLHSLQH